MNALRNALRFFRGLRFRLAFSYVIFFTILLGLLGAVVKQTLSRTLESQMATTLEEEWGSAKGYLRTVETGPTWVFDTEDPDESFIVNRIRRVYMLADTEGHALQHSEIYDSIGLDQPT